MAFVTNGSQLNIFKSRHREFYSPRRQLRNAVAATRWKMGLFDSLKKAVGGLSQASPAGTLSSGAVEENDEDVPVASDEEQKAALSRYSDRVDRINAMEDEIEALSDEEMEARSMKLREFVQKEAQSLDDCLEEAFALVREAAFRTIDLRHYDVQLMGGMALHEGKIAEMATGEGKTLVCTLPAYLNALSGKSVFVVTVNDYLAKRDAEIMGQADMSSEERRQAYSCDITYVTNSELGFDYLRDNLAMTQKEVVIERPFGFCIIDEADSILIDEARTPLIISGKIDAPAKKYQTSKKLATFLERDVHYTVNEKQKGVVLTEEGQEACEKALGGRDLFGYSDPWIQFIINAIKAKELFKKDVNYLVKDGNEIVIVDELTGRAMSGRRWGGGLHQAVEAKEGISVATEAQTIASVSYQSFFSLFETVSGMTGTAVTEAREFARIYGLPVIPIPTALPKARKDNPDGVFKTQEGKVRAIMREIALEHTKGRPLLIGTTSIEDSEMISRLLADVECPHEVLNAKPENVARESEIIAQAGRKYAITIATNMAGRGTDILLGGNPKYIAKDVLESVVASKGGIKREKRLADMDDISNEAGGRLEAAVAAFVDASEFKGVEHVVSIATRAETELEHEEEAQELIEALVQVEVELAEALAEEREDVLRLGGLYVIGTNRHESRRIDNQLRGRAGRQGDPGASRFFLGLDDGIFKVFGGESLQKLMTAFRVDENTPIENEQVTKALDKAQSNVEVYYFDIRKTLWDYDQLLATQRESFYARRRRILVADASELSKVVMEMCSSTAAAIVIAKQDSPSELCDLIKQFFPTITAVDTQNLPQSTSKRQKYVTERVKAVLDGKEAELEQVQPGFCAEIERYLVLTVFDNLWKLHLRDMDYMRQVIGIRSYGSMNPLDEYSNEGFKLFQEMMTNASRNSVFSLFQYDVREKR